MSVEPGEPMGEIWTRWQGHVINGTFPLGHYLGGSDHSGVFVTESAALTPLASRGQTRSYRSGHGAVTDCRYGRRRTPRPYTSLACSSGVGVSWTGSPSVRRHGVR